MIDLRQGDCLEIMKDIPDNSVDLIITDPPYLMNFQSGRRKIKYKKIKNDINNFNLIKSYIEHCYRIMKNDTSIYMFCSMHNIDFFKQEIEKHFKLKNILIWEKNNHGTGDLKGSYAPKYEFIIFAHKGRSLLKGKRYCDILKFNKTGNKYHPTEKPVDLIEFLINNSSINEGLVFDGFMGSGSTGVACKNLNRNFIGIELDETYFNIAKERIENTKVGE